MIERVTESKREYLVQHRPRQQQRERVREIEIVTESKKEYLVQQRPRQQQGESKRDRESNRE